ncbi:M23 family metallopeptidase [Bacillus sp. MCCB 382]|uniref:peptidoglycan DD-metalloendopeptidase family protein n=1 Tax=Bacillus sp. MCCB 382 TaxID=2860197 RepID=UPI001C56CD8A|nr:M23 family metallopeptidase [Bacillus sp. MCCB 382]
MKKNIFIVTFLCLVFFVISPTISFAASESSVKINYSFNTFDEPSFNSTKLNSYNATTVNVLEKQGDWLLIETINGNEWFYNGTLSIDHNFVTYEQPEFTSTEVNTFSGGKTVNIVNKNGPNWYQIYTSDGNKWVYYDSSLGDIQIDHSFYIFDRPTFSSSKVSDSSGKIAYYGATSAKAVAKSGDWYQIITDKGNKWVYTGELNIDHSFTIYENASFSSPEIASYTKANVHIVDKKEDYWYLIHTDKGNKWVYHDPTLGSITIPHDFYIFNSPSFTSGKVTDAGGKIAYYGKGTGVRVVAKYSNWYQIHTDKGNKWYYNGTINIDHNFTTYEAASFSSNSISTYSPTNNVKVVDIKGDWYQIYTNSTINNGNNWVYLGSEGFSLIWPLQYPRVSYDFMDPSYPDHKGVDMVEEYGSNVYAAESGTVIKVYNSCPNYRVEKCGGGFGNHIIIDHGNNLYTIYAHLDSNTKGLYGMSVQKGQVIGYQGNSGDTTATHLHFQVKQGESYSTAITVDPDLYLPGQNIYRGYMPITSNWWNY